ncbi:uncharacterized protein LOC123959636 isoform X2 [Micropterus dolomieu]|uniref:uncharacterized protein LOC123959636 isoform X2 n=1 Tax=Micropterus dolomieu TaxID=147949 RepID=UPI001E8DCD10|nr:uncharacterized protein LOC123959636 isoform X2 [Micropterus dolomieu]
MSSFECLREFVNERLSAAAEEIFGVFKKTIIEYEEEIDRQRRLLVAACRPIQILRIVTHSGVTCMIGSSLISSLPPVSLESSHSNMSVRRKRRFSLTSSSVFRRGTAVWTKRSQNLHR